VATAVVSIAARAPAGTYFVVMQLVNLTGTLVTIFLVPVAGLWLAELNADRFVTEVRSPASLDAALALLGSLPGTARLPSSPRYSSPRWPADVRRLNRFRNGP
jgi:hypothetical protein